MPECRRYPDRRRRAGMPVGRGQRTGQGFGDQCRCGVMGAQLPCAPCTGIRRRVRTWPAWPGADLGQSDRDRARNCPSRGSRATIRAAGPRGRDGGGVRCEVSSRRRAWPARARRCGMTVARPDQWLRRSGNPGAGVASAGGRWWHDLPGQGAPGGDHDEFPLPGADREGPGVGLLENAQHVGHLRAVRRSWAPADHDPLADIGGGEPEGGNVIPRRLAARRPASGPGPPP